MSIFIAIPSFESSLLTVYKVNPNLRSRAGQTPLHIAGIYGRSPSPASYQKVVMIKDQMCRREIYNDLMTKYGAKADLMDMSGQVSLSS